MQWLRHVSDPMPLYQSEEVVSFRRFAVLAQPACVSESVFKVSGSTQLMCAACLSFAASLLHVAVVFGGPDWYRFFGAGEGMATLAARGSLQPALITLGIALMLFIWGLYALSGAGAILKLPFLKSALSVITFVYLARGLAGLVLPFISQHALIIQNSLTFWFVSSLICCVFGLFYLIGTISNWSQMSQN